MWVAVSRGRVSGAVGGSGWERGLTVVWLLWVSRDGDGGETVGEAGWLSSGSLSITRCIM